MKVLVLGASGFLGNVIREVLSLKFVVLGTTTSDTTQDSSLVNFNYTGKESIQLLLAQTSPDCVINCIALADVDKAESDPTLAKLLNVQLPRHLAEICHRKELKLIHLSTDHFESPIDGLREDMAPHPINIYGQSKLEGDLSVLANARSASVIRTNFFARSRSTDKGLVDFVINSFQNSREIYGYRDVFFNPVGAHFLADCIHHLIKGHHRGIMNVSSNRLLSKYEFLCLVAKKLNLESEKILPRDYTQLPGLAIRPKCMFLNPTNLRDFLGEEPPSIESQLELELSGTIYPTAEKDGK